MADGRYWLSHDAQDIDDTIDEVVAARGSEASLSDKIATKQNTLTFDNSPTAGSSNPVKSSGIKTAVDAKASIEDILGVGRQITDTAGQDALTLGKFFCANATDAGNITTSPWNSAYFGFTMRSVSTSQRFVQIAIQNDDNFHMAKRRYTGSWQPWSYITGTAPASLMQAGRIGAELTDAGNDEEEEER